jgi:diguanylate cyclase (GGDEF)-like protein
VNTPEVVTPAVSCLLIGFRSMMRPIVGLACRLGGVPTPEVLTTQLQEKSFQLHLLDEQQLLLNRVISKIRASLDLETIFRTAAKETCKLLQVERVAVYRFFDDWGGEFVSEFEFAEPSWIDLEKLGKNTVWNDSYLQEHRGGRYRQNQPLVVPDVYRANLSQCHLEVLEQFHIQAYATVPIFIGQRLWGVLAAYQHSQPYQWQETQVKFLMQVATHLGFAVKQAELLAQAEQKAAELQMAYEQQQVLFNLVTQIRETLDLDTLFKTMVRETRKTLQADRVAIFQFDPDSHYDSGRFVAEHVLPAYDSTIATPISDHCFGETYAPYYAQGRMQILGDTDAAGLKDCHREVLQRFQIKAQMVMPLLRGGQLWGLLCVHQCRQPRPWKEREIQFIQRLAVQFSVALDHSELLAQSRTQAAELDQTIAALHQSHAELEKLSHIDALTQVANRRCFNDVLDREWRRLLRTDAPLSLLLFDIDHFKAYNDRYGHLAGDNCLSQVAQAAQSAVKRQSDLLARYGGEEFAVILPNTDPAGAVQIAQDIQQAIAALQIPHSALGDAHHVTVSLGVASVIPSRSLSVTALVDEADKALYQAKDEGRDRVVCR